MLNKNLALALGALTGLVSLVAMVRLVSGAFDGGLSVFAWVITLLAMVPWVAYAAARARHGRLTPRHALVVAGLAVVGLVVGVALRARPGRGAGLLARRLRRHLGERLAASVGRAARTGSSGSRSCRRRARLSRVP